MTPNTPLASIYDTASFKVQFLVSESHIREVHKGQKVEVRVEFGPPDLLEGEICFIAPTIDEATRKFLVKAKLTDSNHRNQPLWPGMSATVILAE